MAAPSKSFIQIVDADIDPQSPGTTGLFTRLRDDLENLNSQLIGEAGTFVAAQEHDHDGVNSKLVAGGFLFGDNVVDTTTRTTTSTTFVDVPGSLLTIAAAELTTNRTVFAIGVGAGRRVDGTAGNLEVRLVIDGTPQPDIATITVITTTRFVGILGAFVLLLSTSPVIKLQFRNTGSKGSVEITETHVIAKLAE